MKPSDIEKVMDKVAEVAILAGIKGEVLDGQVFRAAFTLQDTRTQIVLIKVAGGTPERAIVSVESRAMFGKTGVFGGLSGKQARELLLENNRRAFAKFSLRESGDEFEVYAGSDHLLPQLDPEELGAACWTVAQAADEIERKFNGGDAF